MHGDAWRCMAMHGDAGDFRRTSLTAAPEILIFRCNSQDDKTVEKCRNTNVLHQGTCTSY